MVHVLAMISPNLILPKQRSRPVLTTYEVN